MPLSSACSAERCIIVSSVVKMRSPSVLSCVSGYVSRSCLSTRSTKNGALRDVFGKRVDGQRRRDRARRTRSGVIIP